VGGEGRRVRRKGAQRVRTVAMAKATVRVVKKRERERERERNRETYRVAVSLD
jgi:hypothetical protein